jgi:hypothetical protein
MCTYYNLNYIVVVFVVVVIGLFLILKWKPTKSLPNTVPNVSSSGSS